MTKRVLKNHLHVSTNSFQLLACQQIEIDRLAVAMEYDFTFRGLVNAP